MSKYSFYSPLHRVTAMRRIACTIYQRSLTKKSRKDVTGNESTTHIASRSFSGCFAKLSRFAMAYVYGGLKLYDEHWAGSGGLEISHNLDVTKYVQRFSLSYQIRGLKFSWGKLTPCHISDHWQRFKHDIQVIRCKGVYLGELLPLTAH